uniref:HeH/LEM domain-containing protein n=1 Tax=viral metagenome TaxID=1070528 RepID=A0A6C0CJK5_9ZZZZ
MELTYVAVVVLASMMFVLSGMVGYLYWQQTRMMQHLQSLAVVISTQFIQHTPEPLPEPEPEPEAEAEAEKEEAEEDDRLPVVEEKADVVEGPPEVDVDSLEGKTAAQLKEILTQKGIPFGKRDSKPVLIQLIKATA